MPQTNLQFPLCLTIDRTETGYRLVPPSPQLEEAEAAALIELLGAIKRQLEEELADKEEDVHDLQEASIGLEELMAGETVSWEQLRDELGL